MIKRIYFAHLTLIIWAFCALAHAQENDFPTISTTQTRTLSATVTAIDYSARMLTLTNEDGESMAQKVKPEALGLETVNIGDLLLTRYFERTTVQLLPGESAEPSSSAIAAINRSGEHEVPSFTSVEYETLVGTVISIDTESGKFELQDESGYTEEFTADNPAYLARAKLGDKVVFTVEEVYAFSIEKVDAGL